MGGDGRRGLQHEGVAVNLQEAGEAVIAAAEREWHRDIIEMSRTDTSAIAVRSRVAITEYMAACGWGGKYEGGEQPEWCGLFAGARWREVGLKLDIAKNYFPSTFRLDQYGRCMQPLDDKPAPRPPRPRLYAVLDEHSTRLPFAMPAGAIVVIGPPGSGVGKHICLGRYYDEQQNVIYTTEGNGGGIGPDGQRRLGVVHAMRPIGGPGWHVRRVYFPSPDDLES